jgi:hypothetical protein
MGEHKCTTLYKLTASTHCSTAELLIDVQEPALLLPVLFQNCCSWCSLSLPAISPGTIFICIRLR